MTTFVLLELHGRKFEYIGDDVEVFGVSQKIVIDLAQVPMVISSQSVTT